MTRIFWTRRPRVQFIFGAFEQQTSVQVHLPDSLRSALAAATHTELARSPPLAGLSVRRAKQSISRTSAVPCTSWPCEARVFTNDSRFRPRVVRPRVHVSYGAAVLAPVLGVNTKPQVYHSYFPMVANYRVDCRGDCPTLGCATKDILKGSCGSSFSFPLKTVQ